MNLQFKAILVIGLLTIASAAPSKQQEVYEVQDEYEFKGDFVEGDMELEMAARNGLTDESRRWPNNIVYYKIDPLFDTTHIIQILYGMANISAVSCLIFLPATLEITKYVQITPDISGCHSEVGYRGRVQNLNLENSVIGMGCFRKGVIVHELLHTTGFRHQHNAGDRDDYVLVMEENIIEDKKSAFIKYDDGSLTDFGVPYDLDSILHYGPKVFSKNGEKTIIPLVDENYPIGQRNGMSPSDILKLNIMYKCPGYV